MTDQDSSTTTSHAAAPSVPIYNILPNLLEATRATFTGQRGRHRSWLYTRYAGHIYPADQAEGPSSLPLPTALPEGAKCLVAQREICPDTGREHIQGFVQFKAAVSLRTAFTRLGGANLQHAEAFGSPLAAAKYCMKEDTRKDPDAEPVVLGELPAQGRRTDLKQFVEEVKSGKRKRDLIEIYPDTIARYPRFYGEVKALYPPERQSAKVILLVGPTGTGKTTLARGFADAHGYSTSWVMPPGKDTWFDGYESSEVAILDEFKGEMPLRTLLRILDVHAELVRVKGSFCWWTPKVVLITSNYHPNEWYSWGDRRESRSALYRRINAVWEFTAYNTHTVHDTLWTPGCDTSKLPYLDY